MRSEQTKSAALVLLAAGLAACTGAKQDYPSLAMRPFESGVVPEVPAAAPAPIRPVVTPERLADVMADAAAAHSAFMAREDDAAQLARAAAGQSAESSVRASAMIALAELDTQRGKTAIALAALDRLVAEAGAALGPDPALTAAQSEIVAILAREDAAIARLSEVMGS